MVELARSNPAGLKQAIAASFNARQLAAGTAWAGQGHDFFFAVQADSQPSLFIDQAPGPEMRRAEGGGLWYAAAKIAGAARRTLSDADVPPGNRQPRGPLRPPA